jgi:hypothetical protein
MEYIVADNIDEITINYEEDGILVTKELDKVILSKGAWTTIIFRFQQWDRKKEAYGPERYSIRRYRKVSGTYRQQGKFNISSRDQARKIIETLDKWLILAVDQPDEESDDSDAN